MNNKKTRFVEILTALKNQWHYDISHVEKLEVVYGNESIEPYNTSFLVDSLISELCYLVGGNHETYKTEIQRYMYDLNFGEVKGGEYSSAEDLYNKLVDIAFNNEVEINARFKPKETKHYNTDKTDAEYLWPPKSEEEKEKSDQPKEINNREDILSLIDKVRRWDKHWSDNMKLHPPQRTPVEELGEFIESISKKYIIKKREE